MMAIRVTGSFPPLILASCFFFALAIAMMLV